MNTTKNAVRVGAAAFALGLSLAGPQAIGVASADSPDSDSASASAAPEPTPARGAASRRSAAERAARAPSSVATARPSARAAVPTVAVESYKTSPARAVVSSARTALPANPPSRRSRQVSPAATAVSDSAVTPTPSGTVAPVAAGAVALTNSDSVAELPEPPTATATPSGVLWDINTAVVGVLDATQNWLSTLPANPVSDLLEGALLLVRRTLFSQPATVDPVQTVTTATGQIRGSLGAVSPQGSPLSYTLTSDPLLGTVEVSPDGTYVYTTGTDFSEYDSFSVAVDSPGFNILNPTGSWRPAQATVSVWGAPGDGGPPDGALAKPAITRTFEIINLTSSNQMLIDWRAFLSNSRTVVTNVAPVGTILKPGESTKIVLAQYAFQDLVGYAQFRPVDASGADIAAPTGLTVVTVATKPFGSVWSCSTYSNCNTGTTRTVVLLDPPGTVISVPSGQGQKQADVLNSFCSVGRATCSFVPRSYDNAAYALPQQASDSVRNYTTSIVTTTFTVTNTQSTATSLKLSSTVKGSIFKIVEVSVTAEGSQTWTSTYTFSQSINVPVKPGEEVFINSSAPVKAVTGDFFVTLGNSRWNLYDVTFDSPDADRRLRYDAIAVPIPPRV